MRIDAVEIKNFRSFAEYKVELHPGCNLLFGENGAGKTAVLDVLAMGLRTFLAALHAHYGHIAKLAPADTRRVVYDNAGLPDMQPQFPTLLTFTGSVDANPVNWFIRRPAGAAFRDLSISLVRAASGLREQVSQGQPQVLPVLAFHGTGRLWQPKEAATLPERVDSRWDGYEDCLVPTAGSLRRVRNWLRRRALVKQSGGAEVPHIAGIQAAVLACVPDATHFFYSFDDEDLCLRFADGRRLPFSMLSDGYRSILLLVADLAWRAVALNPHLKERAPQESPGVVLIDEVDLSLHPRWQRRVVGDLRRAFPRIQFVVTTHSPQVLGSAGKDCRVLRLVPEATSPQRLEGVYGKDSNAILRDDMEVARREPMVQEKLERVGALIEDEKYAKASRLLDKLTALLGAQDGDVVRLQTLLHFFQTPLDVEEPAAKKKAVNKPWAGTTLVEEVMGLKRLVEKPVAKKRLTENLLFQELVVEKQKPAKKRLAEDLLLQKPVLKKPVLKKPVLKKPVLKKLVLKKSPSKTRGKK